MIALPFAAARDEIADFVDALILVYMILLIGYVLISLIFSLGARIPYSIWSDRLLGFLRDVCEPYLGLFRRFIPPIGPLDLSPLVAIIVLQIVGAVIVGLIRG